MNARRMVVISALKMASLDAVLVLSAVLAAVSLLLAADAFLFDSSLVYRVSAALADREPVTESVTAEPSRTVASVPYTDPSPAVESAASETRPFTPPSPALRDKVLHVLRVAGADGTAVLADASRADRFMASVAPAWSDYRNVNNALTLAAGPVLDRAAAGGRTEPAARDAQGRVLPPSGSSTERVRTVFSGDGAYHVRVAYGEDAALDAAFDSFFAAEVRLRAAVAETLSVLSAEGG